LRSPPSPKDKADANPRQALKDLKRARQALLTPDVPLAIKATEKALLTLRQHAPLRLRRVEVIRAPALGLGHYDPLVGAKLTGNVVYLYVEAESFSLNRHGDGSFEGSLEVKGHFALNGESLGERSLGRHHFFTRDEMPLTAFTADLQLGKTVPPGMYTVDLTVTCAISGEAATGRTGFSAS
jgi:hypothetical protein